jgi:hypothetical protein
MAPWLQERTEARLEDRCMELQAMTVLGTRLAGGDSRAVEDGAAAVQRRGSEGGGILMGPHEPSMGGYGGAASR